MLQEIKKNFIEVAQAVIPLILAIVVLQFTLVKMPLYLFIQFLIGALMSIVGMMLFFVGVNIGLSPMGENIGTELPRIKHLPYIFGIIFVFGFTATLAEPNVLILANQVQDLTGGSIEQSTLIWVISLGLGFFLAMAIVRIILGFHISYLLISGYALILILSFFTPPELTPIAFDSGGFATGLLTIPLTIALGVGLSSILSRRSVVSEGFGVIGLACIGPILAVMIMGIIKS